MDGGCPPMLAVEFGDEWMLDEVDFVASTPRVITVLVDSAVEFLLDPAVTLA